MQSIPWQKIEALEKGGLNVDVRRLPKSAGDEPVHHLAKEGDVVLGLIDRLAPGQTVGGEELLQPDQERSRNGTGHIGAEIERHLGLARPDECGFVFLPRRLFA